MSETPTLHDIARRLNVSVATVSRALNDSPLVNPATKRRVLAEAQTLGYRKNSLARALKNQGPLQALGLLIPDIRNPYYADVARGVEDAASRRGYGVVLCNTDESLEKERNYEQFLYQHRISGLLLTSPTIEDPVIQELSDIDLPAVLISRLTDRDDVDFVCTDDFQGGVVATEHLIRLGHNVIAFLGGASQVTPHLQRLNGYQHALAEAGIPFKPQLALGGSFTQEAGYRAMHELLHQNPPPTAVFAANDLIALGAMEAVDESGLRVSEDVAIVGYDDISFASLPGIKLTTVRQQTYAMSAEAANHLMDLVAGTATDERLQRIYPPELVIRHSCGSLRFSPPLPS